MKPQSIVRFEWLYWAAFAIGMFSTVQTWSLQQNLLAANGVSGNLAWLPYASLAGRIALTVALWFFIARRPSVIAKWIIVVLAAYGAVLLVLLLRSLLRESVSLGLIVPSVGQNLLYLVAAAMLFASDAREWLGEISPTTETSA